MTANNTTSATLLQAAVAAFKRSEFEKAITLLSKAIRQDVSNPKLYDCRALAFLNLQRYEDALNDAERLVKLDATSPKGYMHAGKAFRMMGKLDSAFRIYKIAMKKVSADNPRFADIEKNYQDLLSSSSTSHAVAYHSKPSAPPASRSGYPPVTKKLKQDCSGDDRAGQDIARALSNPTNESGNFGKYALPFELVTAIFQYLPLDTLVRCSGVSRSWRSSIYRDKLLWLHIDFSSWSRKISNQTAQHVSSKAGNQLRSLVLRGFPNITNTFLKGIATQRCKFLTSLELTENSKITGVALADLLKSVGSNLTKLNLSNTKVDSSGLWRTLDYCRRLSFLELSECSGISDAAFEICLNFKKKQIPMALQHLVLSSCAITDKTPYLLSQACPALETLDLSRCKRVTRRTLMSLAQCPKLGILKLSGTDMNMHGGVILDDAVLVFAEGCTTLRQLSLASCPQLTSEAVIYLATFCTELTDIDFTQCANITDSALITLAQNCASLRTVLVGTCSRITDRGVIALIHHTPTLRQLDVSNNPNITDAVLESIAQNGRELTVLNLGNCIQITGMGVRKLFSKPGKLIEMLVIDNCGRVHYETVEALRKRFPKAAISARFR